MALCGPLVLGELGFEGNCVKDTAMSVGVRWGFVLLFFFFLYIWFPLLHKFFPYKLLGSYHLETDVQLLVNLKRVLHIPIGLLYIL